jgi:hypothetical protein
MSRVAALLAAPATAVCLLSGCGAGQINQTGRMVAPVAGVEANSRHGLAGLRDVQIQYNNPQGYPAGATAPLSLYIANNDPAKPLILRSVTATSKSGGKLGTVVLAGGTPDIETLPSSSPSAAVTASSAPSAIPSVTPTRRPSATPSAGAAASAGPSQGPSAGAPAAPSVAPSPSAAGAPPTLTIPANGFARLDPGHGAYLAITAIAAPLAPGSSALVTFTFEGEDPLQITVPFGMPLSPAPRLTPSGGSAE